MARLPIALAFLMVAASQASADPLVVTGGIGGGEYSYRLRALDPAFVVPYREIGAQVEVDGKFGLRFGVQASAREDLAGTPRETVPYTGGIGSITIGSSPGSNAGSNSGGALTPGEELEAGTRWRVAPYASWRWRDVYGRFGLVAGNYYNPSVAERDNAYIYPLGTIGLGFHYGNIELGFLDAPALASSSNGGLGVVALRMGLALAPRHRMVFGVGAPYAGPGADNGTVGGTADNGYFSYTYQARFSESLTIDVGGYMAAVTKGAFFAVGWAIP
jgi:hypothetical protein